VKRAQERERAPKNWEQAKHERAPRT